MSIFYILVPLVLLTVYTLMRMYCDDVEFFLVMPLSCYISGFILFFMFAVGIWMDENSDYNYCIKREKSDFPCSPSHARIIGYLNKRLSKCLNDSTGKNQKTICSHEYDAIMTGCVNRYGFNVECAASLSGYELEAESVVKRENNI